jgi:hypothetical protein
LHDLKFEGYEMLKYIFTGFWRVYGVEDGEKVGTFCRSLIEET